MRFLQWSDAGEYILTQDFTDDEPIPSYAILSHTWLYDKDGNQLEPTYKDLVGGTGKDKPGYEKIRLCGKQAKLDNLQYFWVDTCCINKENKAEESHAINSMFRWYRNAAICYVFLPDVFSIPVGTHQEYNRQSWDSELSKSKWFNRGWTLQELLAPRTVQFFTPKGERIGDRASLQQQIQKITGIPVSALQGTPISQFGMDEPFQWMNPRQTKYAEDKVYSLLGMFDIKLSLAYGEGEIKARERLWDVISRREKCIQDLHLSDPCLDKKRIEETKGGLLKDSYCWILENPEFQQWRSEWESPLLWIKGDPGKGKTMLLCGIINELEKSTAEAGPLSYFFCQATDSRINNAIAVLRGLMYMLVRRQPLLVSHIQKKYDNVGKVLFEDTNAWIALSEIFIHMLQDPSIGEMYLIVDALDECVTDLPKLLKLIVDTSSMPSSHAKWIVSSRHWVSIERDFDGATQRMRLSLELNEKSIAAAVASYIRFKVDLLAKKNDYDKNTWDAIQRYLLSNAKSTFLWVALVCQQLTDISGWEAEDILKELPPGLDDLYRRMLEQIWSSRHFKLCKDILAVVSVVHRPITLDELTSFVDMPARVSSNYKALSEVVALCGSFLTLRERTIALVHQSAKDFLVEKASGEIYPFKIERVHYTVFSRSLQALSKKLRRDVYGLSAPGLPIDNVRQPNPDPLSSERYSCVYWIDHLLDCDPFNNVTQLVKSAPS